MGKKSVPFVSCLLANSLVDTPWKNKAGVTKQIAIHPPQASLEKSNFTWRLSSATVNAAGPFSSFPGFSRFLSIVRGEELSLQFPKTKKLLRAGEVLQFSGDETVSAELPKGPVTDLGIIFDHDQVLVKMSVLRLENRIRSFALTAPTVFFFVASGDLSASVYPGEKEHILTPGDTLRVDPWSEERLVYLDPGKGRAQLIAVEIAEVAVKSS